MPTALRFRLRQEALKYLENEFPNADVVKVVSYIQQSINHKSTFGVTSGVQAANYFDRAMHENEKASVKRHVEEGHHLDKCIIFNTVYGPELIEFVAEAKDFIINLMSKFNTRFSDPDIFVVHVYSALSMKPPAFFEQDYIFATNIFKYSTTEMQNYIITTLGGSIQLSEESEDTYSAMKYLGIALNCNEKSWKSFVKIISELNDLIPPSEKSKYGTDSAVRAAKFFKTLSEDTKSSIVTDFKSM